MSSGEKVSPLLTHFEPGVDRTTPYLLEMVLDVPARDAVEIKVNFEKSILKWLEYPPGTSRKRIANGDSET